MSSIWHMMLLNISHPDDMTKFEYVIRMTYLMWYLIQMSYGKFNMSFLHLIHPDEITDFKFSQLPVPLSASIDFSFIFLNSFLPSVIWHYRFCQQGLSSTHYPAITWTNVDTIFRLFCWANPIEIAMDSNLTSKWIWVSGDWNKNPNSCVR